MNDRERRKDRRRRRAKKRAWLRRRRQRHISETEKGMLGWDDIVKALENQ